MQDPRPGLEGGAAIRGASPIGPLPRVRPVGPADVLARARFSGRGKTRPVVVVQDVGLPPVVPLRGEAGLIVQPLRGPPERAALPAPDVIAGAVQDHGLREEPLHGLPYVVLLRRARAEASATALVVGQRSREREAASRAAAVDAH